MGLLESKQVNELNSVPVPSEEATTVPAENISLQEKDVTMGQVSVYCDLCFPRALLVAAVKFCDFCNRYLCKGCHNSHKHAMSVDVDTRSITAVKFHSPERLVEIKPRGDFDQNTCWISGMSCLYTGELLVADGNNWNVKLIRAGDWSVVSKLLLQSEPFDVEVISKYEAAVTLPDRQRVLYLGTLNGLSKIRQMKVNGHCFGIAHCNTLTAITFLCPEKVEIITSEGNILKRIVTDLNGKEMFSAPYYIAFCPTGKYVYVSDNRDNSVRKISTSGQLLETYEAGDLVKPEGVVVTEDGNVIVASRESHSLLVISSTCSKLNILNGQKSKLVRPWAVCLSNENMLYVSNDEGKHINVYGENISMFTGKTISRHKHLKPLHTLIVGQYDIMLMLKWNIS